MTQLHEVNLVEVEEFISLRRDIHQHPELAFEEHRTAALVSEKLKSWGYEVHEGIGGTGVVGVLKNGNGEMTIGLRADLDALPINEQTDLEWASKNEGVMHACGHDGHTAMLLAAAKEIADKKEFSGTINLIFQPAEEGGGGALRMMEDGLFKHFPCDAIFAIHNMPGYAVGHFIFRDGPTMSSSDYATIEILGVGGHGGMPHKASDPIVAASSIVMALQTIVSRNVDPQQSAVITVGAFNAGHANNVIPARAKLELSVRALDPQVRIDLEKRIKELVQSQAESFGLTAVVNWKRGYAVLVNSAAETEFARNVAADLFGEAAITRQGPALSGSEDFAFMLEKIPGSYLFIGNGDTPGTCMVHNPAYDFNDRNIAIGATFWSELVKQYLKT
ncbi:amidohydrolase [Polynucleobacter wuianus]|jgi:hippurate hydrolase|uniref:Amidohydrolase n=1 Tax=Polynucleobacter wuianus TaxID=1743168 RepID=A0A191UGT5_9BURK|nr:MULTISPECIES: M20 aminoacylase family protein [Polynucleobacter]ANJ00210.1 amidohydrolase [Polynucleobacter wuianus]MBT8570911.1 amidohydrolase [Polynucleobacter paneuropaeus]MBU3553831.1 amidohydrolase [Polynucleobacter sp. MWH-Post4-6-1]MDH6300954.1 hippurate hydrolase [Polynucleobacter sphagniphilus]